MSDSTRSPLWPIRRVFQVHDDGCGIACVAMLAGISYRDACLEIFGDYQGDATSLEDLRWALMACGFRVPKRMTPFWERQHTQLKQHALLALNPGPDGMWHWAVWDAAQHRILDPLKRPLRRPTIVGHLVVEQGRAKRRTARPVLARAAASSQGSVT
jgi:hypothetical protein